MSDRRTLAANDRVAAAHLKGIVAAERYVTPEPREVSAVVADLCASPGGPRERQLLRGEMFQLLDLSGDHAFGYAARDGYVGWVEAAALSGGLRPAPTHRIAAALSYGKTTPGLKAMGTTTPLPFGARLHVQAETEGWARVTWARSTVTRDLFVPAQHLAPLDLPEPDPVAVAERLLGAPYLWGGNSAFGIDCSGLVQAGCLAAGIACPGDSDQQAAAFGPALPPGAPPRRGDLIFWKGHVAWVADADTLIHANAHHMSVAREGIAAAIARIEAQGGGPVTHHLRPVP